MIMNGAMQIVYWIYVSLFNDEIEPHSDDRAAILKIISNYKKYEDVIV